MSDELPSFQRPSLDPSRDETVGPTAKGFPAVDRPVPLAAIRNQGWTLAHLVPPVLVLRERALAHSIALMADYCSAHGVDHVPHGKTTMSPQIWRRQLDAGAWGITAATAVQARVMLAAGVRRVVIANEVADPSAIGWIASQLRDPDLEIVCSVDSPRTVELLAEGLGAAPPGASRLGGARPQRRPHRLPDGGGRTRRGRPREERSRARPGGSDRLRGDPSAGTARRRASTTSARSSSASDR